jgi:uncharacterized membrane protein
MVPERMNRVLFHVLRGGMLLSLAAMVIGLIWFALTPRSSADVIPVERLLDELMSANPVALVELGILILIATPFLRVVTAFLVFAYERDVKFVAISLLVLFVVSLAIVIKL